MSLKPIIKAIIFDMDGVISDTQIIHSQTESEFLKTFGIHVTPDELTKRYAGVKADEFFKDIFHKAKKEMPPLNHLIEGKWKRMTDAIKNNVGEIPGTRSFIKLVKELGLPTAVASASRLTFVHLVLSELGLKEKFEAIVSAEEVKNGKPEPDVFLLAAKRLAVNPENCLVIEDGINGMIAAKRAGMQCIALTKESGELSS